MTIDNQDYAEITDRAMNFQKMKIATSVESNPTEKSKPHMQAVYQKTWRKVNKEGNWELNCKLNWEQN